eukprot:scaffold43655_cov63-Cyclotella_meneghiniana.AAC.2
MLPSCRRGCNNQSGARGSPKCNLQSHSNNSNYLGGGWAEGKETIGRSLPSPSHLFLCSVEKYSDSAYATISQ